MNINVILKLFRFKPTIAWSICGILLGISVAIHEYGWYLNWYLLLLVFIGTVLIQGLLAHAVNDISDFEVDMKTDLNGTNRYKVLVIGITSSNELKLLVAIVFIISGFIAAYLYYQLGWKIYIFYAIGIYAPLAYSLPPLKLGWKPYSEWTIVFPVLVTIVVASDFIATGSLSYLALFIGIIFALYNIIWFLVSRMMDYIPDKVSGKITTFVKLGLNYKESFFTNGIHPYLAIVILLLFCYIIFIILFIDMSVGLISLISYFAVHNFAPRYYQLHPISLSNCRKDLIFSSIINSLAICIILIPTK